jgi:hypothetical protein
MREPLPLEPALAPPLSLNQMCECEKSGLATVGYRRSPRSNLAVEEITKPKKRDPTTQGNRRNRRLSSKIHYLLRSKRPDQSIASEFFTDDSQASLEFVQGTHRYEVAIGTRKRNVGCYAGILILPRESQVSPDVVTKIGIR